MVRNLSPKKIILASGAPKVVNTNKYGIYIPTREELLTYNRTTKDMANYLDVEELIYNDIDTVIETLKFTNPYSNLDGFETSMFFEPESSNAIRNVAMA